MTMSEPEANVEEKRREDAHSREILSMLHTAAVLCHNTQDSNLLSAAVNGFGNITLGGMAGALVGFEFGRSGFSENLKVGLRRSGLGVLIFIGSTLLGVASAVGEMFYGTKNTLQTLQQGCTPVRVWNEIDGKWADPVLDDDIPTEDGDVDEAAFQRFREKYPVDESEVGQITARPSALYDQLGVSPTASAEEITRAYRRQAVQLHPDRHRDDPNATQRFQDLRSTYDVLSNPITRLRYDEGVVESTEEDGAELPFGTVRTCLTTVVGTEAIEPLVGRINLELLLRPRSSYDREMYSTLQYRRRMRVARTLARFLDDESDDFALASTVFEGVQLGSLVGSYLIHYVADEYKKATSVSVDVLPSRFSLFVQAARAYNQYRTEMTMSQETIASVVASLIEEDARCTTAFACSIVLKDLNATKEVRERRRCRLYQLSQFAKKYTTPHHVITTSPENA